MNKENKAYEVKNFRQIKATFLGPTNYRGSRIKIFEPKRYSDQKTQSKIFSYCYNEGDVMEQAYKILVNNGFNVIARASEYDNYIFLCDNWSENFKLVKDLK